MAKRVLEGFLVMKKMEKISEDGNSKKESLEEVGVAFFDWEARSLIEKDSDYLAEMSFEYNRAYQDGYLVFTPVDKHGWKYTYYIEKCMVITGV